jgi:hypothetical protein
MLTECWPNAGRMLAKMLTECWPNAERLERGVALLVRCLAGLREKLL